jgi:hypothetical protein
VLFAFFRKLIGDLQKWKKQKTTQFEDLPVVINANCLVEILIVPNLLFTNFLIILLWWLYIIFKE